MLADIIQSGVNAYRLGRTLTDNPYYRSDAMPVRTGQSVAEWQEKATAWETGWRLEELLSGR